MIQAIINLFKTKPYTNHKATVTTSPDWKKPIELHYMDNILTITTLDHNITQYYRAMIADNVYQWRRYPSQSIIRDNELINKLHGHYIVVLTGSKIRGGYVKVLTH